MKRTLETFLFLAPFPALTLSQLSGEVNKNLSNKNLNKSVQVEQIQQQPQEQKWFSKGDMYEWRNKKAPLKIIICQDDLFPKHILENYDSLFVLRNDSVFEARTFKKGSEWYPPYKVDKNYLERLTDDYLKGWLEQTNFWLGYLSGNKFQLELENIERVVTDYGNGNYNFDYGNAFTMIVHPNGGPMSGGGGYYSGNGIFWIDPLSLSYDKNDKNKCTIVPIHEILHSFFGSGHSVDTTSTIYSPSSHIFLTREEAEFLGWPEVKPKKLERIKL